MECNKAFAEEVLYFESISQISYVASMNPSLSLLIEYQSGKTQCLTLYFFIIMWKIDSMCVMRMCVLQQDVGEERGGKKRVDEQKREIGIELLLCGIYI
jgi:hypothetical protein